MKAVAGSDEPSRIDAPTGTSWAEASDVSRSPLLAKVGMWWSVFLSPKSFGKDLLTSWICADGGKPL